MGSIAGERSVRDESDAANRILKRSRVDIEFADLSYCVGKTKILKSISGKFSSGRLTGILGSSGAGKTSLLNILSGHIHNGVTGNIEVNGKPRDMKSFHKLSCYIMHDDLFQPFLNVRESMTIASKLKLGDALTLEKKKAAMFEVVRTMGLQDCLDTNVGNLSSGQKKRLSIALEIVNNPPVIFLDEPTTGLDNVTMKNCIELLKSLSLQGRTIVCTIHQPSDSQFLLFDQVYFMSNGCCVYNGSVDEIVPFLFRAGFPCPATYSPADYIVELVHYNEAKASVLKEHIANGKNLETGGACVGEGDAEETIEEDDDADLNKFPTSVWAQFCILTCRMYTQLFRNKIVLGIQFGHHILSGVFLGLLFYKIGNNASLGTNLNIKFFYGCITYFLFTHLMSPILLFPFEVKLLQREHFNRWYSLKAYYMALIATTLPITVICSIIFIMITYFMTDQPMDMDRFLWFGLMCILMAITSQGLGYAIGSLFNPTRGAVVGSCVAILVMVLGIHGVGFGDQLQAGLKFIMALSFARHALIGLATAAFTNRPVLSCSEMFCYLGDPKEILIKHGMEGDNCHTEALFLLVFMSIHIFSTYVFLRFRVDSDTHFNLLRYFK